MRLDRIEREEEVLVDVIDCSQRPDLNHTSIACRTVDVSENGMKVNTELSIPVHTIVSLRLDLPSQLYRLKGEVRWARDEGRHYVGLMLDENSPDMIAWNQMFEVED